MTSARAPRGCHECQRSPVQPGAAILATLFVLLTAACGADPAEPPTPRASGSFPVTIDAEGSGRDPGPPGTVRAVERALARIEVPALAGTRCRPSRRSAGWTGWSTPPWSG